MQQHVIHIHPQSPEKPDWGAPCNGCGVCCLLEPCPIGVVYSGRFKGACRALTWSDEARRYHCGVLSQAYAQARPSLQGRPAPIWRRWWWRWVHRIIAAGVGCYAALEARKPPES